MLDLADQGLALGLALREVMFITSLLQMRRRWLIHESSERIALTRQRAHLDAVSAAESYVEEMGRWSERLMASSGPPGHQLAEEVELEESLDLELRRSPARPVADWTMAVGSGEPSEGDDFAFENDGSD